MAARIPASRFTTAPRVPSWPGTALARPLVTQAAHVHVDGDHIAWSDALDRPASPLPADTGLRELLTLPAGDLDAIAAFTTRFGVLCHPDTRALPGGRAPHTPVVGAEPGTRRVHRSVAGAHLRSWQDAVTGWLHSPAAPTTEMVLLIDAAARTCPVTLTPVSVPAYTAAAIDLYNAVIADITPRRCRNPGCGAWFTVQRGAQTTWLRTHGVTYCTVRCAKNHAQNLRRDHQRNQRHQTPQFPENSRS